MSPGILHNSIYCKAFYAPDVELCLGLIKRLADALRELSDGAGCDHETGICYCSEAALLEEAAAFAGGKLCLGCCRRAPDKDKSYCWECLTEQFLEREAAENEDGGES